MPYDLKPVSSKHAERTVARKARRPQALVDIPLWREKPREQDGIGDLDHIATSDVLVLGGGGSFPWLAATLQWRGIILHSHTKDSALDGLPHAYALDDKGRFPCNSSYDFSDYFAARPIDSSSRGSSFRHQVELAIQDYMRWYEEAKPCEGKRGRDGFGVGRRCDPPVFSPACETTASPSPSTAPRPAPSRPARWVNVTAALYPLDARYLASSKACPAACLGKPGKDCGKSYCCKAKGSVQDTFETLSYEHVAFFSFRCRGNINHDFHQNFWPFFWWTAVYNNSDFAILLDRKGEHPHTGCPTAYWMDDLFWALSKANGWKVHNFSSTKDYCITGELHILQGLQKCCDYQLKPPALLRFAALHFTSAVLGATPNTEDYHSRGLIYTRRLSSWRRIQGPEELRPLFRKDLEVEILDDMPKTLVAQARLFASKGLVLAPNGGWAPNVIWMPSDSCLIELHLYQLDSWVQRYLLYSTVGEVLLIVGDYRDPKKKRIVRPKRIGGDDDFLALHQKEEWITRELAKHTERKDLPSVDEFLEGRATAEGTRFFELEDDEADASQESQAKADDWEAMLDAMGVARCGSCGTRLPLDMTAIEQHSKECAASPSGARVSLDEGLMGRCTQCGEEVPLAVQSMEQHRCKKITTNIQIKILFIHY
eukprot:s531_g8.t1